MPHARTHAGTDRGSRAARIAFRVVAVTKAIKAENLLLLLTLTATTAAAANAIYSPLSADVVHTRRPRREN